MSRRDAASTGATAQPAGADPDPSGAGAWGGGSPPARRWSPAAWGRRGSGLGARGSDPGARGSDLSAQGSDPGARGSDLSAPGSGVGARGWGAGGGRGGTAALAVAVAIGLLIGLGAGLLAPRLSRPGDASAEAGFARDMSTHHAQAVQLGLVAYKRATDPGVATLGLDIALNQQGQIGTMRSWLADWDLEPTGSQPPMAWMPDGADALVNGLMPGMASSEELQRLDAATGKDIDLLFLDLIERHHLGGIHMAEAILAESGDDEVRALAQVMVNGQRKEIEVINQLRAEVASS